MAIFLLVCIAPQFFTFATLSHLDVTEAEIEHLCNRARQVIGVRLVIDKETGLSKGFAYAEFADAASATSATRNLHDSEVKGNRLHVDYAAPTTRVI